MLKEICLWFHILILAVTIYVRKEEEKAYNALMLEVATLDSLKKAVRVLSIISLFGTFCKFFFIYWQQSEICILKSTLLHIPILVSETGVGGNLCNAFIFSKMFSIFFERFRSNTMFQKRWSNRSTRRPKRGTLHFTNFLKRTPFWSSCRPERGTLHFTNFLSRE